MHTPLGDHYKNTHMHHLFCDLCAISLINFAYETRGLTVIDLSINESDYCKRMLIALWLSVCIPPLSTNSRWRKANWFAPNCALERVLMLIIRLPNRHFLMLALQRGTAGFCFWSSTSTRRFEILFEFKETDYCFYPFLIKFWQFKLFYVNVMTTTKTNISRYTKYCQALFSLYSYTTQGFLLF